MAVHVAPAVPFIALEHEAVPESVGKIRRAVAAFVAEHGASRALRDRISSAVGEAASNAVVHAYPDGDGHRPLSVQADIEDGDIEVVVLDAGEGFRTNPAPGYGLGLAMIERSTDDFLIRNRIPGGVEVWMRFRLAAA
jgi:anti-sigma regulatory factor (Ser/Thr protein kinase)